MSDVHPEIRATKAVASAKGTARRIAFWFYVPAALVWIFGTDIALAVANGTLDAFVWLNMVKGGLFVLVTGSLLYVLILREIRSREARDRDLRTLAENVPDLIFRLKVRPEVRFEYVSPAAVEIAGYTPEEHYQDAHGVLAAVHPEDRRRLHGLLEDIESAADDVELRWVHKDGRTVWTEIRATKEWNARGRVERVAGVVRDVTDRHRSERRRLLLEAALEAANDLVMITDRAGVIEYVNPAFTEVTGYSADEASGATPRLLNSGRQDEAFYADLWGTIFAGRTFRGVMVNRRADGRLYDQATSITPVYGEHGEIAHFVAVARDITVQRELERRLRHTEKMDAVGQLAASVAHDFRNLLNVILLNAEALAFPDQVSPAEPDHSAVREISGAARRGSELVNRLLRIARQPEVRLVATDLAELVRDLEGTFRTVAPGSIEIQVRAPDTPCMARVDPGLIQDALINLVMNAAQATSVGGRILVRVEGPTHPGDPSEGAHTSGSVSISVRDSGHGMDAATLARVFEPFFTTKDAGTGLGLPMVKTTMERHAGKVEVSSRVGEGTTVTLRLPSVGVSAGGKERAGDPLGALETEDVTTASSSGAEPATRVLLVDDEAALRSATTRVLERLGYQVDAAENGRAALERIAASPAGWDLVISDLVMPEIGGLELYELVRERGWDVPFLFMSGQTPGGEGRTLNPDRGHAFIEKPWTVATLTTRVRAMLAETRRPA